MAVGMGKGIAVSGQTAAGQILGMTSEEYHRQFADQVERQRREYSLMHAHTVIAQQIWEMRNEMIAEMTSRYDLRSETPTPEEGDGRESEAA
jgi:hypothetical protein